MENHLCNVGLTVLAAVELFTVHMIDGRVVQINPAEITRMAGPVDKQNKALPDGVRCVISFTDGKFLSVSETCSEVQAMVRATKGE